jgi:negative regulator of flagellin synthesis FlgM
MVNNINGLTSVQNNTNRNRDKAPAASDKPAKVSGTAKVDQVELSPESREIKDIESGMKRLPELNHERVNHIRQALRDGNYSVDPARLAAKIVQFELNI